MTLRRRVAAALMAGTLVFAGAQSAAAADGYYRVESTEIAATDAMTPLTGYLGDVAGDAQLDDGAGSADGAQTDGDNLGNDNAAPGADDSFETPEDLLPPLDSGDDGEADLDPTDTSAVTVSPADAEVGVPRILTATDVPEDAHRVAFRITGNGEPMIGPLSPVVAGQATATFSPIVPGPYEVEAVAITADGEEIPLGDAGLVARQEGSAAWLTFGEWLIPSAEYVWDLDHPLAIELVDPVTELDDAPYRPRTEQSERPVANRPGRPSSPAPEVEVAAQSKPDHPHSGTDSMWLPLAGGLVAVAGATLLIANRRRKRDS